MEVDNWFSQRSGESDHCAEVLFGAREVGSDQISAPTVDSEFDTLLAEFDRGIRLWNDDPDANSTAVHSFGEEQHLHGITAVPGQKAHVNNVVYGTSISPHGQIEPTEEGN